MLISSLCVLPVNISRSRMTFFYHVSDQLQRAYSYVAFYIFHFFFRHFSIWQLYCNKVSIYLQYSRITLLSLKCAYSR